MVKRDSWQNLAKSLKLIGEGGEGGVPLYVKPL